MDVEKMEKVQSMRWSGLRTHMACERGWRTGGCSLLREGVIYQTKKGWSSANTIREAKDHEIKLVLRVAGKIMKNDNIHKHCLDRFRLDTRKNFLTGRTGQLPTELVMSQLLKIFKTPKYKAMADLVSNVSKSPDTKRRLDEATCTCPIHPRPLWFCDSQSLPFNRFRKTSVSTQNQAVWMNLSELARANKASDLFGLSMDCVS